MIEGSCLCGAVAFAADRLASPSGHCHCDTCRKAHGAAFALRTGAVDTDPGTQPAVHIWVSHARPWLRYGPELPRLREGPGSAPADDRP